MIAKLLEHVQVKICIGLIYWKKHFLTKQVLPKATLPDSEFESALIFHATKLLYK